jgi:glycosyltransferase involved in cell wall biosynthesis
MRILVISNCHLNPGQGSGYVICGYADRMRARGHDVVALGPEHFTLLPKFTRLYRLRLLVGYTYYAAREVLCRDYDVVELWGGPGWLATLILRLMPLRRPVLVSRSNGMETHYRDVEQYGLVSARTSMLEKLPPSLADITFRYCHALTLVSVFEEAYAKVKGYQPDERLLVLENPLEDTWLGQEVNYTRAPVVGFVGSWLKKKGADIIPTAIRMVLERHDTVRFVLIGLEDKQGVDLRNGDLTESRVDLIPFCSRESIRAIYHRIAILLMPSTFESFGLVAAEAMSCGAALVSTRVGIAARLSDSEYLGIDPRTPEVIADRVIELLSDEPKRQGIAQAGYMSVQGLRWNQAVEKLEAFYLKLLQRDVSSSLGTAERPR